MPRDDLHSSIHDLVKAWKDGQATITADQAYPVVGVSRASFYRFMASSDAPAGMCLKLGRKRLLSLPVFLKWIGAEIDGGRTPE